MSSPRSTVNDMCRRTRTLQAGERVADAAEFALRSRALLLQSENGIPIMPADSAGRRSRRPARASASRRAMPASATAGPCRGRRLSRPVAPFRARATHCRSAGRRAWHGAHPESAPPPVFISGHSPGPATRRGHRRTGRCFGSRSSGLVPLHPIKGYLPCRHADRGEADVARLLGIGTTGGTTAEGVVCDCREGPLVIAGRGQVRLREREHRRQGPGRLQHRREQVSAHRPFRLRQPNRIRAFRGIARPVRCGRCGHCAGGSLRCASSQSRAKPTTTRL